MELTKSEKLLEDLKKAVERLREAVGLEPTRIHKDATIQRFEFTFELAWKLMYAALQVQGVEAFGPRNVIRQGVQAALIDNPEEWFKFLELRNLIAHVYKEQVADEIYEGAKEFPGAVDGLIRKVEEELK